MRIAVLRGPQHFEVVEQSPPTLRPDEVLVRVVVSGVCASELETWVEGPPSGEERYLGHEVSGVVVAVGQDVGQSTDGGPPGSVPPPAVGDRVGVWVTERGYADHVAVRAAHCFPAGDGPLDLALAEPLACAVNAVELADVRLGDDVVVIGAGFMGNLVQALVARRGVRHLVVADARADALQRAEGLGATRTVDVGTEDLGAVVRRITHGRGADLTFECTGTERALVTCGDTTRMSGKIAVVGFHQGEGRTVPLGYWNWMAFSLLNGHFRDVATILRGMEVGMRLHAAGLLPMADLVTHRFALDDIDEAFATLRAKPPGFAKAVIVFPEP